MKNLLTKITNIVGLCVASQMLLPINVWAGTNLSAKETFNGQINYMAIGGSLRSNANDVNACSLNTSSSAELSGLSTGITIQKAYLYWSGSGSAVDSQVTFNGQSVTAEQTYTEDGTSGRQYFQGVKDVTDLVAGNGTYTLTDLSVDSSSSYCSNQTVLSGWSLVVIYQDPSITDKYNTIQLYEGFKGSHQTSVNYTLDGILVPFDPDAKFSMLLWEGDATLSGANEYFKFNGNLLTDTYNPLENQFNSSVNTLGSTNTYGVDFDTFDVASLVSEGDTSVTGTISTDADLVFQGSAVVMVSNEVAD
jgi:hypothetical protein